MGRLTIKIALIGAAGVSWSAMAVAQDVPPPATTDSADSQNGIGDIVVTAQRRAESLQRAAVAVDVVSGDAILNAGVSKSSDLQNLVPSLQITGGGGSNTSFFLRGVGTFSNNSYSDPAIAFNYDGVYVGRPAGSSGVFYDLERVEVLKGPQGTLYGRNATGGAINVIPARPKIGETSGFLSAGYGNYNAFNAQGAINIATSATSALRLSGTIVDRNGYLSDGTSDDKGYALRGQFLADLTPDLTVRIAADYYKQNGNGGGTNFTDRIIYNPVAQTYIIQPSGLDRNVGLLDPRSGAFLSHTFLGLSGNLQQPLQRAPFLDNSSLGHTDSATGLSPLPSEWHP
jgi:iron complex outermembrane recepter protein